MRRPNSSIVRTTAVAIGFTLLVTLLVLWLSGSFSPKIPDGGRTRPDPASPPLGRTAPAKLLTLPVQETAVGSIEAVHKAEIASRLAARVVEANLKAGQPIARGEVLVRLDDSDLSARIRQAQANLQSARAVFANARVDFARVQEMRDRNVASPTEFDRAQTTLKTAEADVTRAEQAVTEAQAALDYAVVKSPIDGLIVDKKVNVGDTVMPGQVMAVAYDPRGMQLVASVRESLVRRLKVGQTISVQIDVLDNPCHGVISEIVPEAQTSSRSFQVKVTGPCPPGIYSGLFGRIIVPVGEEQVLVVPASAVLRVGQLEQVDVVVDGRARRRAVRSGREMPDGMLEILSGLSAGETVIIRDGNSNRGA